MNQANSQPWYALYADTMVELDHRLLVERIEATEAAIHGRLHDLRNDSNHHEELQQIEDAKQNLVLLRRCYAYESSTRQASA